MNDKVKEAQEIIKRKYILDKTLPEVVDTLKQDAISSALMCDSEVTKEYLQRIEEVKEVVKLHIIKKPVNPKSVEVLGGAYDLYDCPTCSFSRLESDDIFNYCPNCGQKLDWSEIE